MATAEGFGALVAGFGTGLLNAYSQHKELQRQQEDEAFKTQLNLLGGMATHPEFEKIYSQEELRQAADTAFEAAGMKDKKQRQLFVGQAISKFNKLRQERQAPSVSSTQAETENDPSAGLPMPPAQMGYTGPLPQTLMRPAPPFQPSGAQPTAVHPLGGMPVTAPVATQGGAASPAPAQTPPQQQLPFQPETVPPNATMFQRQQIEARNSAARSKITDLQLSQQNAIAQAQALLPVRLAQLKAEHEQAQQQIEATIASNPLIFNTEEKKQHYRASMGKDLPAGMRQLIALRPDSEPPSQIPADAVVHNMPGKDVFTASPGGTIVTREGLDKAGGRINVPPASSASALSPEAAAFMGNLFLQGGGKDIPLGFGQQMRKPILEQMVAQAKQLGMGPEDVIANQANLMANRRSLDNLTKFSDFTGAFADFTKSQLDLLAQRSKELGILTDTRLFNVPIVKWEEKVKGDPKVAAYLQVLNTAQADLARIISAPGSMATLPEGIQAEVRKFMNAELSPKAILELTVAAKKEIANREKSYNKRREAIQGRIRRGEPEPEAEAEPSRLPNPPASMYKEGDKVTLPNGRTVTIGKIYPDGTFDPK